MNPGSWLTCRCRIEEANDEGAKAITSRHEGGRTRGSPARLTRRSARSRPPGGDRAPRTPARSCRHTNVRPAGTAPHLDCFQESVKLSRLGSARQRPDSDWTGIAGAISRSIICADTSRACELRKDRLAVGGRARGGVASFQDHRQSTSPSTLIGEPVATDVRTTDPLRKRRVRRGAPDPQPKSQATPMTANSQKSGRTVSVNDITRSAYRSPHAQLRVARPLAWIATSRGRILGSHASWIRQHDGEGEVNVPR